LGCLGLLWARVRRAENALATARAEEGEKRR
jgi:hypothetical protein